MKLLKSLIWMLIMALTLGMMVGCSDDDDDNGPAGPSTTDYFEDFVTTGSAYFGAGTKNITGDALYADMGNGVELFVIDYRSADHYANVGHMDIDAVTGSNATLVNWAIADLMDNLDEIPAGAKVVNVCYSGQTASQATSALRLLGYDAWNLKWGMCGWTSQDSINLGKWSGLTAGGWDLETESNASSTYDYPMVESEEEDAAVLMTSLIDTYFEDGLKTISSTDVFANVNDGDATNDLYIMNYWPPTYYDIGHIPGAVMFDSSVPEYKSLGLDALDELPTDQQIVVYCWTGQTSSQITVYLNLLGYDAYSMKNGINGIQSYDDSPDLYKDGTWYHAPDTDYPIAFGE
ncbi:MAG: rhodanese-like domain-containing protein [Candidatus Electryonea clarkiae]|nr:rhodanese-like domain-containing protein [Candidatus Electryonea clarkiae]MDP8287650.1 rhodanese-like domain-containing protein [Candidatus Electryonea clarkiae]